MSLGEKSRVSARTGRGLGEIEEMALPGAGGGRRGTGGANCATNVAALKTPSHAPWAPTPCPLFSFPDTDSLVITVLGADEAKLLWAELEQEAEAGGENTTVERELLAPRTRRIRRADEENPKGGGGGGGEEPPQQW